MKLFGLLPIIALGWEIDARNSDSPIGVWLDANEEFSIIVGGSAGTGGQWMHYEPNPDLVEFVDQKATYEAEDQIYGGPFKLKMNFKAGDQSGIGELRLAYARPWQFDSSLMQNNSTNSTNSNYADWESQAWNSQVFLVQVDKNMKKVDLTSLKNTQTYQITATVDSTLGGLVRIYLRETPASGFRWSFDGTNDTSTAAVQILQDIFEPASQSKTGIIGIRQVTFQVNTCDTNIVTISSGRSWESDKAAGGQIHLKMTVPVCDPQV